MVWWDRVVLAHDWLTGMRGGEKVLEVLCELFPTAPLFALVHEPASTSPRIEDGRRIVTTILQHSQSVRRRYRSLLPLFPWAIRRLRPPSADLMVSTSSCVGKAVPRPPGALHVCYCHTPMRYIWSGFADYATCRQVGPLQRAALRLVRDPLRRWDLRTNRNVDHFIANSRTVAARIRRTYGREATVIHPPVECDRFAGSCRAEDFYLIVSALVPYKRVDLAIEAVRGTGRQLKIVGDGPLMAALQRVAGPEVRFLGFQPTDEVARLMRRCRALLFCAEEDFGIVPVEAQAAGRPVIAYGRGGATETVIDARSVAHGATGVLFAPQSPAALREAIEWFEAHEDRFDPVVAAAHARRFDRPRFRREILTFLERLG
jgi:glycosyltransferase involved in cell wall biosynthesis